MPKAPSGPRITIATVGTICLFVFYVTWKYGAGWHWISVALTALFTVVALVTSIGEFRHWDDKKRNDFNDGMAVAALALLLATTIGDAVDPSRGSIDYTSIALAFGIPFFVLVIGLFIERR